MSADLSNLVTYTVLSYKTTILPVSILAPCQDRIDGVGRLHLARTLGR